MLCAGCEEVQQFTSWNSNFQSGDHFGWVQEWNMHSFSFNFVQPIINQFSLKMHLEPWLLLDIELEDCILMNCIVNCTDWVYTRSMASQIKTRWRWQVTHFCTNSKKVRDIGITLDLWQCQGSDIHSELLIELHLIGSLLLLAMWHQNQLPCKAASSLMLCPLQILDQQRRLVCSSCIQWKAWRAYCTGPRIHPDIILFYTKYVCPATEWVQFSCKCQMQMCFLFSGLNTWGAG